MAEKSYFRMQLDSAIRETEKLLKTLRTIGESRDLEDALKLSVTAAKISEGVALKTRALPAHTHHPQAERVIQEAISESVPVDIKLTEEGWFYLRMPILLPRKEKSPRTYLRGFLYPALAAFARERPPIRYRDCVMIFRHTYDRNRPEREYRDHDNIELNTVVDAIAMFFLVDDTPFECRHEYDAFQCEINDRSYLCWTISPEISCVIEYSADVNDEADIFRMAQSVQLPE